MIPYHPGFLETIQKEWHPDDIDIYLDWMEEQGTNLPFVSFARKITDDSFCSRKEIFTSCDPAWFCPHGKRSRLHKQVTVGGANHGDLFLSNSQMCLEIRSGFVVTVTCTEKIWLEHAGWYCRHHPVRAVFLINKRPLYDWGTLDEKDWRMLPTWKQRGVGGSKTNQLAVPLFLLLQGGYLRESKVRRNYLVTQEAIEDLSNAALLYGKEKA
jgi:hypothetical protein